MESRIEEARARKASGKFNCAQAVACTYADLTGLTPAQIAATTASFGTGMGNTQGTCGALVGAGVIVGLVCQDRIRAMKTMRRIMDRFQAQNSATACCQLKGLQTGRKLRDCNDCVADAAAFLEAELS